MMDNRKYHCRDGLSLEEIEFRKGTIFDVIDPVQDGNDDPELKPCPLCGGKVMTMWDSIVCPHCKLTVEKQYTHDSPADIGSGVTEPNLKKLWNERVGVKGMMEFKIQVFENGEWHNTYHDATSDYEFVKNKIMEYRYAYPHRKYRIVGHEVLPWCEIKESEVK